MKSSPFQFSNPALSEFEFVVNPLFSADSEQAVLFHHNVKTEIRKSTEEPNAVVEITFNINKEISQDTPFCLHAVMCANFKWEKSLDEKMVDNLLSQNAPALLVGYLRPIIALVTGSSPYPAYNLPFMNFNCPDGEDSDTEGPASV